jgi:CRISPR-associated protein Cmr2
MIYGGITIGPIITTLTTAKKERELWFSSYMFSWLMENFSSKLKEEGYNIVLPTSSEPFRNKAIGIYPDRLVFTINNDPQESSPEIQTVFEKIQTIYNDFLQNNLYHIYEEISADSSTVSFIETQKDRVINIIRDYLQVKWFVTKEELTLMQIISYLDIAEHSTVTKNLVSEFPCDRCRILPSTLKVKDIDNKELFLCPICAIRFGAQYSKTASDKTGIDMNNHFPSLVEISAAEIKTRINNKNDYEISDILEKESEYLSYFAVLCIDLDYCSKYLKTIKNDPDKLKNFSLYLENFLKKTTEHISKFCGRTIYAGGDDLLALIPIKNDTDTLLNLICDISEEFEKEVIGLNKLPNSQLSFSAGISVQYYKHPLNDALVTANNALFKKAKSIDGKYSMCMTIRKHSGATFEFKSKIDDLSDYSSLLTDQSMGLFLQEGFYQKLANLAPQFAKISSNRIDYLIDNYFNESCHKSKKEQFNILKDLIKKDWDILTEPDQKINKIMNIVNLLRFAKLLK